MHGAADAEDFGVAGDFVGEVAGVVDDRPQLPRQVVDVGGRFVEVLIELRVVHQLAQRAFAAVELLAELLHLTQQFVEAVDAFIGAVDEPLAALAERLGEAFEVLEVLLARADVLWIKAKASSACLRVVGNSAMLCRSRALVSGSPMIESKLPIVFCSVSSERSVLVINRSNCEVSLGSSLWMSAASDLTSSLVLVNDSAARAIWGASLSSVCSGLS